MIGRIFASEIWRAYFREGLFLGGAYYRNFTVYNVEVEHKYFELCQFLPVQLNAFKGDR